MAPSCLYDGFNCVCSCGHVKVIFNTHDLPHQKVPHSCTFDFSSERIVANFTAIKLRRFYFLSIKGWNNLKFLLYVNLDLYSWFGEEPILQFKENVLRVFKIVIPIIEKTKKKEFRSVAVGTWRYRHLLDFLSRSLLLYSKSVRDFAVYLLLSFLIASCISDYFIGKLF